MENGFIEIQIDIADEKQLIFAVESFDSSVEAIAPVKFTVCTQNCPDTRRREALVHVRLKIVFDAG